MILEQLVFRQISTNAQIQTMASKMLLMAVSSVLFWLLVRSESSIYEFYWLAAVITVVLVRYIINELLLKQSGLLSQHQQFFLFNLSLVFSSGVWSTAGYVFYIPGDDAANGIMVVLMITIIGIGAYSYINNFISLCCYALSLFVLPILVLIVDGSTTNYIYAFAMSAIVIFLLSNSHENEQLSLLEHVFRTTTEQNSLTDTLTKLPNRTAYHQEIHRLRESMINSSGYAGLLLLNVDRFKEVNNIQGQHYGDSVLLAFSRRLKDVIPKNAILARLGGVQFILLLPYLGPSEEEAQRQITNLSDAILADSLSHYKVMTEEFFLEVSIGASVFNDQTGSDADLLKFVELALDEAKSSGRNCCTFYNIEMSIQADNDSAMLKELREAARKKTFLPHYQPVYCVKTNKIKGAEVLLRWSRSDNDVVVAAEFIHLLERSSLMNQISSDLIVNVCDQIASWYEDGLWSYDTRILFNLCAGDIRDTSFVDKFFDCLHEHGLPAAMFEFEMTERDMFQNTSGVMEQLDRIVDAGATLAIDDFGTGYSGLNYLKNMPVSTLKIDKTFIDGILDNKYDKLLINGIVEISQVMNLDTIAEGVEDADQLVALQAIGCNFYQGYLASRPLSASDFAEILIGC
jgi:diguanylate cyclase (GGDEF)-like protein